MPSPSHQIQDQIQANQDMAESLWGIFISLIEQGFSREEACWLLQSLIETGKK